MSTPTTPSAPLAPAKITSKITKASKHVVLRLRPHLLAEFPSAQPIIRVSRLKHSGHVEALTPTSSDIHAEVDDIQPAPAPISGLEVSGDDNPREKTSNPLKRKAGLSSKPATVKRSAQTLDANGLPKPRGKPGPKKRVKTDGDPGLNTSIAATPHHKLGPKANQGAINAGLRALDRTGKPARKWFRRGFQIKSFTSVIWHTPSWKAPSGRKFGKIEGEDKSGSVGSSEDLKVRHASSMPSEKSNNGVDLRLSGTAKDIASYAVSSPAMDILLTN